MTDFRDPNDPLRRPADYRDVPPADTSTSANARWGWAAAAVFIAVVMFIAFTSTRQDVKTAANTDMSPPVTQTVPPARPLPPSTAPQMNPTPTPAPSVPAPASPPANNAR